MRLSLARAQVGAKNLSAARDVYKEVLGIAPRNWDALFELGKTYASLGDTINAKQRLEELIRQNPSYAERAEAERILTGL